MTPAQADQLTKPQVDQSLGLWPADDQQDNTVQPKPTKGTVPSARPGAGTSWEKVPLTFSTPGLRPPLGPALGRRIL
jgi:hypothetical protein